MKRVIVSLGAGLCLLIAPAAHAAPQQCGGHSPIESRCSFTGTLALEQTLEIVTSPEFTGRIRITIDTGLGRYHADCVEHPAAPRECTETTSGTLIPGDPYTLTATTTLVDLPGTTPEPASIGRWLVILS